jgi:predicted Zn-dependent protease
MMLAASTAQALEDAPPSGYSPDPSTIEGGLWMAGDKAEAAVKTSPQLVRDSALNAYVRGVVCKLAGDKCSSIRVYIVEVPRFNAYMMPNGAMVVWTGLLLRVQNEAQLAFILGHELTHYLHRHALESMRRAETTTSLLTLFSVATAGAGVGIIGSVASLAAAGMLFAHTRDQERDADSGGFDLAIANSYDPHQAASIWQFVMDESHANPHAKSPDLFTSTHPTDSERLATLTKKADAMAAQSWVTNEAAFHGQTQPFLDRWLEDELNRGEPEESVAMLERLVAANPSSGPLSYYLGEAYRRRNAIGDVDRASNAYKTAIATSDRPAAAYRGLGLLAMKGGDKQSARDSFTQYLAAAPAADDRAMIQYYLSQLQG